MLKTEALDEAQCLQAGLGDEPRQVIGELSEIALVDVLLPARSRLPYTLSFSFHCVKMKPCSPKPTSSRRCATASTPK